MSNSKSIGPTELAKLVAATGATVILRDVIIGDMHFPEIEIQPAQVESTLELDAIQINPELLIQEVETPADEPRGDYCRRLIEEWLTNAQERRLILGSTMSLGFDGSIEVVVESVDITLTLTNVMHTGTELVEILERTFGTPAAPEPAIHLTADHTQIMRKCVGLSVGSATFVKNCYQANKSTPTWVRLMELRELGLMEREDAATGDLEFFFVTPEGMEFLGFPHSKVEA